MSDRKSRIFASIVIILIVMAISFLFMTRENYVRYSFYDATGCQYIEVTKMENAKGENSIKHLSLYKYGYFKPCYTRGHCKNRSSNQNRILQVHSKKLRKQINLINVIAI